ncbi:PH domain-containing protein [Halostagnicola bangensis]
MTSPKSDESDGIVISSEPADSPDSTTDLEWLSLEDGESVHWIGGPDWRTITPIVALLLLPLSTLVLFPFSVSAGLVAMAVLSIVTLPVVLWAVLRISRTDYVVTSSALYKKRGVFSRDVKRVDFEKVQNSTYTQTAVGNVMGYGHVGISTAGGAGVEMRFASVRAPKQVQAMISRYRSDEQGADERPDEEVLEEILAELRAIRSAVEDADVSNKKSPSRNVTVSHDETELDK